MSIKFSCVTLRHMSFGAWVVVSVSFKKIDDAPYRQACANGNDERLKNAYRGRKEFHFITLRRQCGPFFYYC